MIAFEQVGIAMARGERKNDTCVGSKMIESEACCEVDA
jgi:hypothetical protein